MSRSPSRSFVLLLAAALVALAGPPGLAGQDRPWTVDDVLGVRSVGAPELSPDGRRIVYAVSHRDMEEDESVSHLRLVPADGSREAIRLTNSPEGERSPAWAPDGSWIAFVSGRDGESQVWGIRPDGGEAWKVTEHPAGVGGFLLSPDGRRIAFTASSEKSDEEKESEELRGRPEVWDSAYASDWTRLWVAELDGERKAGEARLASPDGHQAQGAVWSPDSRRLAWSARPSPALRTYPRADVFVASVPVEGEVGPVRKVSELPGGEGPEEWVDGLGLLVSGSGHELGTYNDQIWLVDVDGGGDPVSLTDAFDYDPSLVAADPDALWLEAYEGTRRRLWQIPLRAGRPTGEPRAVSDDASYYWGFSPSDDRSTWAFVAESNTEPPDVHVVDGVVPGGAFEPRRLTHTNPGAAELAVGEQRVVRWRNRDDGEEIEGVLTLPVGYVEGDVVPLLLVIHGGPAGVSTERFTGRGGAYPIPVFSGMGYAVLQPNYRGSTGYGERFRGLNRGDISGSDWVDVDSGVDFLVAEGIADPDRLGVMGWSFGGHHTYWGITRTDRYRAASAGAGAADLVSMYSQTDIPEFYHTYLGPRPWEDFELYEERSAYRYVERVTTPLLIQVGERDERVPAEQSIQFYVAMKAIGNAPVELVVYPGQPHGVRSPRLQRDLMERNVAWFERWIPAGTAAAEGGG